MTSTTSGGTYFNLLPEIRNMIYTLVLSDQTAQNFGMPVELLPDIARAKRSEVERPRRVHLSRHPYPASCLAILQTCRAINDEACGIFYGNHEFMFRDHLTITPSLFSRDPEPVNVKFEDFLRVTSSARLESIAKIRVIVTGAFLSSRDLARLPNLKNLSIRFQGPKAMKMFRPGSVVRTGEDTSHMRELCKSWTKALPKLEHVSLHLDNCDRSKYDSKEVRWMDVHWWKVQRSIEELEAERRGLLRAQNEKQSQRVTIQSSKSNAERKGCL
ncbi:hypothetical protein HII31_00860 [Pseudocercospora fuligena]|uniref:F-box domain-containing protein n=1 Tax=Pseudocercospora fuligena TaxID=685502 RepID=A0A8H6RV85_9PEZI|nr:hypothetical protein HII31_00860 [Pseudocercospora fuligena]